MGSKQIGCMLLNKSTRRRLPYQNIPAEPDLITPTMSKIRIANPQPGCAKYTTASQAERYVRRKKAALVNGELRFLAPNEQRRMAAFIQTIHSERRASDVYIP